ncbi:hypothetical protein [Burkholderia sp. S171]|uniref:hypothetical protein n=1 Tax=Burkholderia sp. S171 TaxID=1641860 RepID=UPI00131D4E13|nr:hypothetical protein [Burkholderia sp. S171]
MITIRAIVTSVGCNVPFFAAARSAKAEEVAVSTFVFLIGREEMLWRSPLDDDNGPEAIQD